MQTVAEPDVRVELEAVRLRLDELEATTRAIQGGEVDAIMVEGPHGPRLFTLQSPEEPYRLFAERMNEGAATLAVDGTILFCNRRLGEMAGRPGEQLVGSGFSCILQQQDQVRFAELVGQALESDIRTEGQLLRPDGTLVPIQLSLSQIPLQEPERGICLVAADLSAQKRVEEEVRRLNAELEGRVRCRTAELEKVNRDLEAFSYAVAHDLRAPLRHILAYSQILQQDAETTLSNESRHCIDRVLNTATRMHGMLEALLNLSLLERQTPCRKIVALRPLVDAIVEDLGPETQGRKIEWHIGELPTADYDPALIKIVMSNLLSNAVKYTRQRATATIAIGHKMLEGESAIFVRDNGAGFNMKYADKLFVVFQRLHHAQEFEGTGVGLATVQRIINNHGGRIWAEAEVDKGATFYFTLGESSKAM
jgi:PAS domain S-box-containing protein